MLHFNQEASKTNLFNVLEALKNNIYCNINCVKVASVVSFDIDTLVSCCQIKGKRLLGLKKDGNQELTDYPLIYAKTYFLGYGDIGITHPIVAGVEGILLFSDRELETWYTTGESGNLAYDRTHDLSDAIFICGLCSQPNLSLIQYLEDCLNIYYKNSNLQIFENNIDINTANTNIVSNITQTGNNTINGTLQANQLNDTTAANGFFISQDNKKITVVNGIIRTIKN